MSLISFLLISCLFFTHSLGADPTNYEYYTSGGIKTGLRADSVDFTLNGHKIRLLSGSLHYFRCPWQYWKDRLLKFRAAGLNTVQIYVPWNLHEETPDNWDFESGFLNLKDFLKAAKEADMFVVFRIGPYICAEWEMGGYPAWLSKDRNMRLRSNYKPYLAALEKFFKKVLSIINEYQFTKGGPIIALQFENEFGGIHNQNDHEYFQFMKDIIEKSGFKELLINCDPGDGASRAVKTILPGVLETDNFNSGSLDLLKKLRAAQPNKPLHVTEFWPGWFDKWGERHHLYDVKKFEKEVTDVMFNMNSSINYYMFFGGTNFGFMNGDAVVTSYDYDAPLSESGNYTPKYWKTKELNEKLIKERNLPKTHIPNVPAVESAAHYGVIKVKDYLSIDDLVSKITPIEAKVPTTMEDYGQNFGFINYRITTHKFNHLKLEKGVNDRGYIILDDREVAVVERTNKDYVYTPSASTSWGNSNDHKLDIIVENNGRINGGDMTNDRKGLWGNVVVDDKAVSKYTIYRMEFKEKYVEGLKELKWKPIGGVIGPALFRAELEIKDKPRDTFLRLDKWKKGNVFVNGFNIGRYNERGPQKTLYVPAPMLKTGANDIYIFELHSGVPEINFVDKPDLG